MKRGFSSVVQVFVEDPGGRDRILHAVIKFDDTFEEGEDVPMGS